MSNLPMSGHREAITIIDDALSRYCKIIQNMESVPVTAIAMVWDTNHTRDHAAKTDSSATNTKCQTCGGDDDRTTSKSQRLRIPLTSLSY